MSRSSEGSFGSSGESSFSFQGTSGSFDTRHRSSHGQFNDRTIYWNSAAQPFDDRTTSSVQRPNVRQAGRGYSPCFCMTPAVIGSIWMLFGLYGSRNLEMGQRNSRLLEANSLFVKEIVVENFIQFKGPILYGFPKQPVLDTEKHWIEEHEMTVPGNHHQEWALWLNKGSQVKLEYNISDPYIDLLIVMIQGEENLHRWIDDPTVSDFVLSWKAVQGNGMLAFKVDKDDAYYFALGNMHLLNVQVKLRMVINSTLYNTEGAISECHLTKTCSVRLSFLGTDVALLTTPEKQPGGVDVWRVQLVYKTRWATYCFAYGGLLFAILAMMTWSSCRWRPQPTMQQDPEFSPLLPSCEATGKEENFAIPQKSASGPHRDLYAESPLHAIAQHHSTTDSDENLCIICFEAGKNSFFDPCGHSATCYTCGLKIKEQKDPRCPICRQSVNDIRKLFLT